MICVPDTRQLRDVVIGSGPNGLAAAILLARAGRRVVVYEANDQIGGGTRSAELTLAGICARCVLGDSPACHCIAVFRNVSAGGARPYVDTPQRAAGASAGRWNAVMLEHSIPDTARGLGPDGAAWAKLMRPLVDAWPELRRDVLSVPGLPRHPLTMARFGLHAIRPARSLALSLFRGERARALLAGLCAHSMLPLDAAASAAIGLVQAICAHAGGWPLPRGGSQKIAGALASYLRTLGGEIVTGTRVTTLPDAPLTLCDISPRVLLSLAGARLPAGFRSSLEASAMARESSKWIGRWMDRFRGRRSECLRAGTVHLGGTLGEIAEWEGNYKGRPFVLVAQQSLFDETRAPRGRHTAWAYCHVPNGSSEDMTSAMEAQIERFAPGFSKRILARHVIFPADVERGDANMIGGDINGGSLQVSQMFLRPTWRLYGTPLRGVYLCSASTPPGGGVHGMCGYNAVRAALK